MSSFPELQFNAAQNQRVQVREHVRGLILSGALPPGQRLPTTAALAMQLGSHAPAVHHALRDLVAEGLLDRRRALGTFVCIPKPTLTAVAIYELADSLASQESGLHRVLIAELQRQLTAEGINVMVQVDPRRGEALSEPWEPLDRLSRSGRVGASIILSPTHTSLTWMGALPRVAAFTDSVQFAGRVSIDYGQMAEISLRALAAQGCRSVGLINSMRSKAAPDGGRSPQEVAFFNHFIDTAADYGLEVHNDWMITSGAAEVLAGQFKAFGHKSFRALWKLKSRPEGLIVFPDSSVSGVLMAMAELGVKAPDDLRLAYHRNEQMTIFNPSPATEAILSEREIATALIAQARRLSRDEPCEPVMVGFRQVDKPKNF